MSQPNKNKKSYSSPLIREKEMTGHFMICGTNTKQCPPGTQIKQDDGRCMGP